MLIVMHFSGHELTQLISQYGYWVVMLFVGVESIGIPFPGETMLLAAAIYAGTTHNLDISLVIAAASAGAVLGDNIGYWFGREFGYELLLRFGRYIHFDQSKMKLGMYLFLKHGGKVVFFGRFVAVLRAFAALLAGINQMDWPRFFLFNIAGGITWATILGLAGYNLGKEARHLLGTAGIVILVVATALLVVAFIAVRRNQRRLEAEAERTFPGSLMHHIGKHRRAQL
ncbi:MAG TPA: DedA family protein [Stellaceae bacterium]|nr:DedA family protein [Stellaceae bacterium]